MNARTRTRTLEGRQVTGHATPRLFIVKGDTRHYKLAMRQQV